MCGVVVSGEGKSIHPSCFVMVIEIVGGGLATAAVVAVNAAPLAVALAPIAIPVCDKEFYLSAEAEWNITLLSVATISSL